MRPKAFFFLFSLFFSVSIWAENQASQLRFTTLKNKAEKLNLHKDRYWLKLLQYKKNALRGYTSLAKGEKFFMSKEGRYSPQKELEAVLRGFIFGSSTSKEHPQCRFPARFDWLKKKLSFKRRVPKVSCPKLNAWIRELNPESVKLVFASSYLGNPASVFGHTFLLVKKNKPHLKTS